MNNLKFDRNDWQTHVTFSGWYAWKYTDTITNDALGVEWFDIQDIGVEKFVVYYKMGYCLRHKASIPLSGLLVCPVDVTKKGEDTEVKSALEGMLSDWMDQFGQDTCDCRPEPENQGHICNVCKAKIALKMECAWDHAE